MSETDSFIDEVTEEVRRDRLFALIRRYGWIAVVLIVAIVAGAALNEYRKAQATAQARAFGDAVLAALEKDSAAERAQALGSVGAIDPGPRAVVGFLEAGALAEADREGAAEILARIESDADLPLIYRQIAAFKRLTMMSGLMPPEDRRVGFEALAAAGQPLRLLSEEQLALIDIETGDTQAALDRLNGLLTDAEATPGLQQRALQVIVSLGGEPNLSGLIADEAAGQ